MIRSLLLFLLFPSCILAQITPLNGNGNLGSLYRGTKCGLNFVQVSVKVTQRTAYGGPGSGLPVTLAVAGLPACTVIEKAYVWYEVSYNAGSPTSPTVTMTNPLGATSTYTASLIGTDIGKNWGEIGSRAFRTDVSACVAGNGNYKVNIATPVDEIDGLTFIIIYSDPTATFQGNLFINDGIITKCASGAVANHTMSGFSACGAGTNVTAFLVSGDFQFATHSITAGSASSLSSPPVDKFWNFDVLSPTVSAGMSSIAYSIKSDYVAIADCFALVAVGLYFQTSCAACGTLCLAVPLEFNAFKVFPEKGKTKISWKYPDANGKTFVVEKSRDGNFFSPIASVISDRRGNEVPYEITDELLKDRMYYRIKVLNNDGSYIYTEVKSSQNNFSINDLKISCMENVLRIYELNPENSDIKVSIINSMGQTRYLSPNMLYSENGNLEISLSSMDPGIYILKVETGNALYTGKFKK